MLGGAHEQKRGHTKCGRDVSMHVLPGVQVLKPTTEEYPEEHKKWVQAGHKDSIELEKWVKVEHCWVRHHCGNHVQSGRLCQLQCGVE